MRPATVAVAVAALAACSPQIDKGTYFCGPERFCPPDLACDEPTFTCEAPSLVDPFACPEGSELLEPDDTMASAQDVGETACGGQVADAQLGCIVGDDADLLRFVYKAECAGADPHLEVVLRFPIAFAPLVVELLDEAGELVATGVTCTPSGDFSGQEYLCLELRPPSGTYFLRVRVEGSADCDGACRYNQYYLDVVTPLS
jgi:hypothetical protein